MGLDLLPRPKGPQPEGIEPGKTHRDSEPCPFEQDHNPIGVFGTCCSFRANPTALYLVAMGLGRLALELYADKGPVETGEYAKLLRAVRNLDVMTLRLDAQEDDSLEKAVIQIPDVGWSFPLGRARQTLEAAATWHTKVALAGFGVHAWF
jgi:hypothetical protein